MGSLYKNKSVIINFLLIFICVIVNAQYNVTTVIIDPPITFPASTIKTFNLNNEDNDFNYFNNNNNNDLPDITGFISKFLPISELIENDECKQHSLAILKGFKNLEPWALRMVDASAKLQSGILDGNIKNLGQYDECVEARGIAFSGQYCLANINVAPLPGAPYHAESTSIIDTLTLGRLDREITVNRTNIPVPDLLPSLSLIQMGVCVPSSCSPRDVEITLSAGLQWLARPAGLQASAQITAGNCSIQRSQPWSPADLVIISIVLLFVIMVICSTAYDQLRTDYGMEGPARRALLTFSMPVNWNRLFSTDCTPGSFGALEGIRVLSTLWVIMTHKILLYSQEPWVDKYAIVEALASLGKMPLINTMLNVDTFLLVSGLLKSYHFLRDLENKRFNFFSCYSRRYFRLTPAYALMMGFYATLLVRLSNGPAWDKYVALPAAACRTNWPFNLLYLNNYINSNNQCMIQTWYLAADMQLCLISPIVVYPLFKWPRIGKMILGAAIAISIAIPLSVTYFTGALPTYLVGATDEQLIYYLNKVYYATHNRMSPYFIGIALGYLLYKLDTTKLKMTKLTVTCGWVVCFTVLYAVVFGAYDIIQYNRGYHPLESTLYGGLHRAAWATAVAWLIFACHTGYGGWINRLLSARAFQPLSRLSYCIFLTHYVILMVNTGRMRTSIYIDEYVLLHDYAGDLFLTLIASMFLYLFVEAPLFELTKIIYGRAKPSSKSLAPSPIPTPELENVTPIKSESDKNSSQKQSSNK